ncbi:2,3-bisphosphoglycerate-independent phosphoglycerate mutase [Candidatus Woesearchaeota archaeon]|nr:2,3-bisphosphoglycerate-independent phosphoglycerate mutase [Candidatus Woesearchaeota archaeon]
MNKVVLIILDGWGCAPASKWNAITTAKKPVFDKLLREHLHCTLRAAGENVGLLKGNIGNSEVGHLHIGAGRLVKQDVVRIFDTINDETFFKNKILLKAMHHSKEKGRALHLLGLLSDANVHSNINHLFALLKMADKQKVPQVYVHAFLDGRDVAPQSAMKYIKKTENELRKHNKNWKIATITGRYYAMDRDNRWNREHKAYDVMVNCKGHHYNTAEEALTAAYNRGETDEFVKPSVVAGKLCTVKECDSVIFFNFRSDRARQLTKAFIQGRFGGFKRKRITPLYFVCMTQYDQDIKAPVAFEPMQLNNTLGEVIANNNLRQFRLAETEKWAHVTYFFNGLSGRIFKNEERLLIPSPKVSTYDKTPSMSSQKITTEAIKKIQSGKYSLIVINFANADMVGHTGDFNATIKAVETLDKCIGKIVQTTKKNSADIIITADHGNAERKKYPDGTISKAHTTNKVPFILITEKNVKIKKDKNNSLHNIALTVLELLSIKKPKEMTAQSLLQKKVIL